jgi:hypothetical protein
MATATEHIHDEVRELIRRRGIDPVTDQRATRLLIDEVITHYEERVPNSTLPPLIDRPSATRFVFDALAGFGPLQRYLEDCDVEEIWIDEPGRGLHRPARPLRAHHDGARAPGEVRDLVERMLKPSGRRLDLSSPFVDALLPRRLPAARRHSGHHPRAPLPQHPQVRGRSQQPRRPGIPRNPDAACRLISGGLRNRRAEHRHDDVRGV